MLACAGANDRPPCVACSASPGCEENGGVSAPAPSEPRGALDRGMGIVVRCDRRWLRRRPGHLGRRHTDAHNDPIPVPFAGDPARTWIRSPPPFNLSGRLITIHGVKPLSVPVDAHHGIRRTHPTPTWRTVDHPGEQPVTHEPSGQQT